MEGKNGRENNIISWEFNLILSSSDAIKFYALRQCFDDDDDDDDAMAGSSNRGEGWERRNRRNISQEKGKLIAAFCLPINVDERP